LHYAVAPSAGDKIADVYMLIGDGEASESIPTGGDGTTGADVTPQAENWVGALYSVNPSTSVDEVLSIPGVRLGPGTNRLVLLNGSGQSFALGWTAVGEPIRIQGV
jgi:hypothetical protein